MLCHALYGDCEMFDTDAGIVSVGDPQIDTLSFGTIPIAPRMYDDIGGCLESWLNVFMDIWLQGLVSKFCA